MALVERLIGTEQPKIPVHDFFAACHELVMGRLTVTNIKTALNMDAAAQSEFDSLVALAPSGSTALAIAQKAQYVESMHSVFILAEGGYTGYATAANVRSKLGI